MLTDAPQHNVNTPTPMPRIKISSCKYDGISDPDDHIVAYEGHMYVNTQVNAIWYKVFSSTLIGII